MPVRRFETMLTLIAQSFPSIPDAPKSWTEPAAFGYVVLVLLFAAVVWLWAKSRFAEKRMDLQSERLKEIDKTQKTLALVADPKAAARVLDTEGR